MRVSAAHLFNLSAWFMHVLTIPLLRPALG